MELAASYSTYQEQQRLVDRELFRSVMSRFASGVSIITTRHEGIDYGLTASAVCSVSLDPPMLLICVNKTSNTQKAIAEAQVFAVNILREEQSELAHRFAGSHPDKFAGMSMDGKFTPIAQWSPQAGASWDAVCNHGWGTYSKKSS